jgi:lycopene cyclase domain-containing protein
MNYLYLALHGFTILFPLIRSFEPRMRYSSNWKYLFPAIGITASFFLIWDIIFTSQGIWGFNHDYTLDLYLFGLPLEEWLFFITVPFATVFIYEAVKYFLPGIQTNQVVRSISLVIGILIVAIGIFNFDQAYTFYNFIFAGSFVVFIAYKNPPWLGKFWIGYLFHLIPFFLCNGLLTGAFTESPIVWYNNEENFGIRLFTIPVEDTIYSLLLLLMNITLFEYFKNSKTKRT